MADQYLPDDRMMLKARSSKTAYSPAKSWLSTTIVIARGGSIKVIQFKIYVKAGA